MNATINIGEDLKEYFNLLQFNEEEHTYIVDTKKKKSVSKWVETFVEHTDFDAIAQGIADYKGVTKEEIQAPWIKKNEESIIKGHRVHAFAEGDMVNPELPQEFAVVKFHKELDFRRYGVVCKELKMYHQDHSLAGTCDLLLYDCWQNKFIIADYKTNEDLFKNYKGKTLVDPFEYLLDTPYNHYQIQLSFYQLLVEQTGIEVSERWVIWLKDDGDYMKFETIDLTVELKQQLSC